MKMQWLKVGLWVATFVVCLQGCYTGGEEDTPGQCTLSCGSAKIGSSDFKVKPITNDLNIACASAFATNGVYESLSVPVTTKFLVTRASTEFHSKGGHEDEVSETNVMGGVVELPAEIPVGGILFNPVVTGMLDGTKTDPENGTPPATGLAADPPEYSGIVTPKSEWCTDSCGVATLTVWPVCLRGADNEINVNIMSGGANAGEVPAKIHVKNE